MIYGIDVSSYQAAHFPTTVAGHSVGFSFIKATEGTGYVNPRMKSQAAWARSHDHVAGFYHFVQPGNMTSQAAYFVSHCDSTEGDILALDWEVPGVSSAAKDEFLREVKRLRPTHRVMLYCSQSYWTSRDASSYAADGLWIAQYNGKPGKPAITADWKIHQYTSTPVDTNIADWASASAMRAWARGLIKAPTTTPPAPAKPATKDTADMKLSDKIDLGSWIPTEWPTDKGLTDGQISVETALGSAYGHARYAHDKIDELTAKVDALTELVKSLVK